MTRPALVVGFDDSPSALSALRWAAAEALRIGGSLRAVHALSWPFGAELPDRPGDEPFEPTSLDEIDAVYHASITATFDSIHPRPDWILQFADGDAGPVLVRQSKHAYALVIGAPYHTGPGRLLVGSVAHYCLSHAVCPVVAVPAGYERLPKPTRLPSAALVGEAVRDTAPGNRRTGTRGR
jgi:nucleotide-binding universal stress UspA family protein